MRSVPLARDLALHGHRPALLAGSESVSYRDLAALVVEVATRLGPTDLSLVLSTSGSTGSPKLVRLSHENLQSNTESIAAYPRIQETDRAATLTMACYGLSVIHSHLLRGAGVILTDDSVVDPCLWDLFRRAGATTFAAVPYTFDLLAWVPTLLLPRLAGAAAGGLASASLYLYLTHYQVYPLFGAAGWVALAASVAAGVAYWRASEWAVRR